MAQATNVVSFPSEKLSWEKQKFNRKTCLRRYRERAMIVGAALNFYAMSPSELKAAVDQVKGLGPEHLEALIESIGTASDAFEGLADTFRVVVARLVAAERNLI